MTGIVLNQSVRELAEAYVPNVEDARLAYADAVSRASIVDLSVGVFRALAPHADDLDHTGVAILCGVSDLIVRFRCYEMTEEAATLGVLARERLSMME